jgi:hypothetical protein
MACVIKVILGKTLRSIFNTEFKLEFGRDLANHLD